MRGDVVVQRRRQLVFVEDLQPAGGGRQNVDDQIAPLELRGPDAGLVGDVEVKADGPLGGVDPVVHVVEAVRPEVTEADRPGRQVDAVHVHRLARNPQHDDMPLVSGELRALEPLLDASQRPFDLQDRRQQGHPPRSMKRQDARTPTILAPWRPGV